MARGLRTGQYFDERVFFVDGADGDEKPGEMDAARRAARDFSALCQELRPNHSSSADGYRVHDGALGVHVSMKDWPDGVMFPERVWDFFRRRNIKVDD